MKGCYNGARGYSEASWYSGTRLDSGTFSSRERERDTLDLVSQSKITKDNKQ